jgi:hypothetical protein
MLIPAICASDDATETTKMTANARATVRRFWDDENCDLNVGFMRFPEQAGRYWRNLNARAVRSIHRWKCLNAGGRARWRGDHERQSAVEIRASRISYGFVITTAGGLAANRAHDIRTAAKSTDFFEKLI